MLNNSAWCNDEYYCGEGRAGVGSTCSLPSVLRTEGSEQVEVHLVDSSSASLLINGLEFSITYQ